MKNTNKLRLSLSLLALLPGVAAAQDDTQTEYGVKAKFAWYTEDARDLGQPPPPGGVPAEKLKALYADLDPYLHVPFDDEGSGFFARVQMFGTSGDSVFQQESERAVPSKNFVALRELYLDYGGLTSFPGEVLRFGLQRVRDTDGLWWDREMESLRWLFDTTLVQAQLGAGEQFSTYRTDDIKLTPSQRKRAYAFATFGDQWQPGYFNQIRVAYAQDHGEMPQAGDVLTPDTKTRERKYVWVGLVTHNGFYDPRSMIPVHYWLQAVGLGGRRESPQTAPPDPANPGVENNVIGPPISDKVLALAGDAGLRVRFPLIFPLEIGAVAAYAQGDAAPSGTSHVFEPTGLESNRSRFTGGRTLSNRFSEALQAHWSNLRSAGGLVSLPFDMADFSAVYQVFKRDDGTVSFQADGISAQPINQSRDIGRTVDLVISKFFRSFSTSYTADDEDQRANVRLRAARFFPGEAYGPDVKTETRVTLETTWWF